MWIRYRLHVGMGLRSLPKSVMIVNWVKTRQIYFQNYYSTRSLTNDPQYRKSSRAAALQCTS
jgi:hypothetical protein